MKSPGPFILLLAATLLTVVGSSASGAERAREREQPRGSRSGSTPAANAAPPATAAISPVNSFEAFNLIVERNIFNPNRVGRTRAAPEEKAPRIDEISLVGTMHYEQGVVAFFDSPDSAFKKTLRVGETVADFKVQSIAADGVELLHGEKPLTLKVAQQLRRAEGGDWNVITLVPPAQRTDSRGAPLSERSAEAVAVEIPADASDALKRLMEKRKKQLQK